jgi:hypothetical protein
MKSKFHLTGRWRLVFHSLSLRKRKLFRNYIKSRSNDCQVNAVAAYKRGVQTDFNGGYAIKACW